MTEDLSDVLNSESSEPPIADPEFSAAIARAQQPLDDPQIAREADEARDAYLDSLREPSTPPQHSDEPLLDDLPPPDLDGLLGSPGDQEWPVDTSPLRRSQDRLQVIRGGWPASVAQNGQLSFALVDLQPEDLPPTICTHCPAAVWDMIELEDSKSAAASAQGYCRMLHTWIWGDPNRETPVNRPRKACNAFLEACVKVAAGV